MNKRLNPAPSKCLIVNLINPLEKSFNKIRRRGVKITIKNLQKKIPVSRKSVKNTISKVFLGEDFKGTAEITVCLVNDAMIKRLNRDFHGVDGPTDVMAFDMGCERKGCLCADIVISTDTLLRNCGIFKTEPAKELRLYLIHGILHLLGYGDAALSEQKIMRKKESKYVN